MFRPYRLFNRVININGLIFIKIKCGNSESIEKEFIVSRDITKLKNYKEALGHRILALIGFVDYVFYIGDGLCDKIKDIETNNNIFDFSKIDKGICSISFEVNGYMCNVLYDRDTGSIIVTNKSKISIDRSKLYGKSAEYVGNFVNSTINNINSSDSLNIEN